MSSLVGRRLPKTLMKTTRIAAFVIALCSTGTPAVAAEVLLACLGATTRNEGLGEAVAKPAAVQLRIDTSIPSLRIDGLSCWAGKGDCTRLRTSIGENQLAAFGDGKLTKSGFITSIELDRRTGFLKFSQHLDRTSGVSVVPGPVSETGEFVCQVALKPVF